MLSKYTSLNCHGLVLVNFVRVEINIPVQFTKGVIDIITKSRSYVWRGKWVLKCPELRRQRFNICACMCVNVRVND